MRTCIWTIVFLFFVVAYADREVEAKPMVSKTVRFVHKGDHFLVSTEFKEAFNSRFRKRLKSGFNTTIVIRLYLYREKGGKPIAVALRKAKVFYDIWEERYLLKIEGEKGERSEHYRDQEKLIKKISTLNDFALVHHERLKIGKKYFVAGIVEVNPMSKELLAAVRKWLRRPSRRQLGSGGDSFFGSFVSIFVNKKIRRAEHSFHFRSQLFYRAK